MLRLADFDAVTFDVYGTLIDWEPSITRFLADWAAAAGVAAAGVAADGVAADGVAASGEALIMAFDRARAAIQKERPAHLYPEVLRRCLDRVAAELGIPPDADRRAAFAAAPHAWPAYPDAGAGLRQLQARARIGALSNIDNASLASSCARMAVTFDIVVTAERVGAYKPGPEHFEAALADLAALGIPRSRVLHVGQSLRADIAPANRLGLRCVWINRPGRVLGLSGDGAADARPDLTVASLAEMLAAIA